MIALDYRATTPADLPFILALVVEDSVVPTVDDRNAADAAYGEALGAIDADPNNESFTVWLDGTRVGTFQLTYIPGLAGRGMWRGQIENVHVIPEMRSRGVGAQMIRWAVDRCRARGCGSVQLTSNKQRTDAHRFYERLGFSKSHDGFKLKL